MDEFKSDIKTWVQVDNKMKTLNEELRLLRQTRSDVSDRINNFVEFESLETSTISISDGKLKFIETKQQQPLTLKYIKQCLEDCIDDDSTIENIMNVIKESRTTRAIKEIKRYYNKS